MNPTGLSDKALFRMTGTFVEKFIDNRRGRACFVAGLWYAVVWRGQNVYLNRYKPQTKTEFQSSGRIFVEL